MIGLWNTGKAYVYSLKNPHPTLPHTLAVSNSILQGVTALSDIFIDKCATQSRNILSSNGRNIVGVILGGMGERVMIDYSQTELLLLI